MTDLISIIIPIYNLIGKVERCLDSVLAQTVKNFELLLIDDGSYDGSEIICDIYAKKDKRVRVFHKTNGGVSAARNLGIENAKGKLITFIDGDDFVSNDYLESLLIFDEDLCIGSVYYSKPNGVVYSICHKEKNQIVNSNKQYIAEWFDRGSLYSVWACMFKTSIIKKFKLKFLTNITRGEDVIFMLNYVNCCKKVRFSSNYIYYYVRYGREGSSSAMLNSNNIFALDYLYMYLKKYFKRNGISSKLVNSYEFWIKCELRGYLYDIVRNQKLSDIQKKKFFELLYSLKAYKNIGKLFEKANPIVVCIIKLRSPEILVISSKVYSLLHKSRLAKILNKFLKI